MGFPEDDLAGDEDLLLHRHPHWKMLFWPAVIFIVTSAVVGFVGGLAANKVDGNGRLLVLGVLAVVWLAIVGWLCVAPFLSWKTTHFVVTNRRVLFRHGILTHSGIDIALSRISSVQFTHGVWDRMFGTGKLIIESASQDPLEFDEIPQVKKVHSLMYHQVFDDNDGQTNGTETR
ncbi:PH domain-containing protein [Smaragdicoccus niigatensis]|uniref:PH domain-containing protein n=1 Tax=Smaragdicoccus niigatensis TaxID=359359 RepID=UPI000374F4C4|nr:PH domain-containing protein [Smaragdicoccus niigatensis]